MGMTIDNSCEPKPMSKEEIVETLKAMVFGVQAFERFNAKERETLDKAWNIIDQYENRLKADLEAILDEIDLELAEQQADFIGADDYNESYGVQISRNVIREKINALKGEEE